MAERREDGGPAFPLEYTDPIDGRTVRRGMPLRDWFAGQALAGLIAAPTDMDSSDLAVVAYGVADQMLKERTQ